MPSGPNWYKALHPSVAETAPDLHAEALSFGLTKGSQAPGVLLPVREGQ